MRNKPSYEELQEKVKTLEKQLLEAKASETPSRGSADTASCQIGGHHRCPRFGHQLGNQGQAGYNGKLECQKKAKEPGQSHSQRLTQKRQDTVTDKTGS